MCLCPIRHALISSKLKVSCLPRAVESATAWRATAVLSLLDPCLPDAAVPVFNGVRHLVLRQYDQESAKATTHFSQYAEEALSFIKDTILVGETGRLLLHCHAGASRSTAFALGAICVICPELDAETALQHLLAIVNKPWPNRRIVEEIDAIQGQHGLLLEALDRYRARYPRRILAYRVLNRKRGLHSPVVR